MAFFGIVGMGYEAMVPAYARRVVGTGVYGYSVLLACGGIGATVGAFAVASLGNLHRKELLTIAGMVLFGCSLAGAALLPSLAARGLGIVAPAIGCIGLSAGSGFRRGSALCLIPDDHPACGSRRAARAMMGIWMIAYSSSVPLARSGPAAPPSRVGVAPVMGLSAVFVCCHGSRSWTSGLLANPRVVSAGPVNVPPGDDPPLPMDAPGGPL